MRFLAFVSVCFSATAFGYNFGATMPVGDSLTSGWEPTGRGGYRGPLYEQLTHQLQPVGSLTSNGWNLTPDERAHEGHDGWRTEQISAGLSGWIDTYSPNTILLMTGTNNTGDWNDPALTRQKVSDLFDTVFALDPYRMLFAANIPDANPNISWEWAHRIHADNVDAAVRAEVLLSMCVPSLTPTCIWPTRFTRRRKVMRTSRGLSRRLSRCRNPGRWRRCCLEGWRCFAEGKARNRSLRGASTWRSRGASGWCACPGLLAIALRMEMSHQQTCA
jgi:hypothetical protein